MRKRIDLSKVKTVSLRSRPSKVETSFFAGTLSKPVTFGRFWDSLPDILAGKTLKI